MAAELVMRLWSLHPRYLDRAGLVTLWREGLLARAVLAGKTKGYTRHPQLARFRAAKDAVAAIDGYLEAVYAEACRRGYHFDAGKFVARRRRKPLLVITEGQLAYEYQHLCDKLRRRDPAALRALRRVRVIEPHPLFAVVAGGIASWEKPPPPKRAIKTPPAARPPKGD